MDMSLSKLWEMERKACTLKSVGSQSRTAECLNNIRVLQIPKLVTLRISRNSSSYFSTFFSILMLHILYMKAILDFAQFSIFSHYFSFCLLKYFKAYLKYFLFWKTFPDFFFLARINFSFYFVLTALYLYICCTIYSLCFCLYSCLDLSIRV